MKTRCTIFMTLFLSTFILSCSKDDDDEITPTLVTAQLFDDTSIMENSSTAEFKITLDKAAELSGYIIIGVSSTDEAAFETIPAVSNGEIEVPILKGSNFAIIKFSPENNDLLQEPTTVTFNLLESSEGIMLGSKRTTTIEITDDEAPVSASFLNSSWHVVENIAAGTEITVDFSLPAPGTGSITVQVEGNTDNYYITTYPALNEEQKFTIPVEKGSLSQTFRIYPKNNALLENHKTLNVKITEVTGVIVKGDVTQLDLLVVDDEIQGKLKSVEIVSNNGNKKKKTWEYTIDGKVNKVAWEEQTVNLIKGTDYYTYSPSGDIESISPFMGDGEHYIWQNGKVVRSEKLNGFFKIGYSTYDYNATGKIESKTVYQIKADGNFTSSARYQYEYFPDGNMKKETIYLPGENGSWTLSSSLSYDSYTDKVDPAPMEIIPTFRIQEHLPLYYTMKGDGVNLTHYFIYNFDGEGKVIKKTSLKETTTYSYY